MSGYLRGETLIYFGPEPWAGLWRNRHQLMSRLAQHNTVVYVEPPVLLRDLLGLRRRGRRPRNAIRSRLFTRDASGVVVFHSPWWLPQTGRPPFKDPGIRLLLAVLGRVAGVGRQRRPIVWYSRPGMVDYVDKFDARLVVYHVVDEYSGYGDPAKTRSDTPGSQELRMLREADVVIVVTPTLFDRKSPYNPNTFVVPNAVDFDAYAAGGLDIPGDMADIRHPVIGYFGLVAARLDLDMLGQAADKHPDWSFVFVGAINDDHCARELGQLRARDNVHFLGSKPVDEVPAYVRRFDVCMIPYRVNLRAENASPLKLYEYAAASKPIVSTNFAAARAFEGDLAIVNDSAEFVAACEAALTQDAASSALAKNRQLAQENTWDHRVRQIAGILEPRVS